MIIDIGDLTNNKKDKIIIDNDILFPDKLITTTTIRRLENVHLTGSIAKLIDGSYEIVGTMFGNMILPDDITLEDFNYAFSSDIEEKIEESRINLQKALDITEILWQNILVEIPLKAVNPKNENIRLEGDGWRLISEEEAKSTNNPLSELEDLFKEGVERDGSSI